MLTEDVQNRYLLTYTPQNQKIDGSWRAITVKTNNPDHVIRTRTGYFAPKPPPIRPAIEFTAIEPSGRYLNLTAEDLEVVENGVPQQVETFQEAVQPVSIVLALDASGSMVKKEADVVASAREFISALRPQDQLALMLFADRPMFAHDFSKNHQYFINALKDYKASGGTALYDALSESLARLKRVEGRRVVVVMTDGRDEDNPGTGPGSVSRLEDVDKVRAGDRRAGLRDWPGRQSRPGAAAENRRPFRRPGVLSDRRERTARRVPPRRRRSAPAVRRRIHVVEYSAGRQLA